MKEKTTKSNDSSMELKMENIDPASQALLAKMNGYNFDFNAVGFQPETGRSLDTDEIMEGVATTRDSKIEVVKNIKLKFKQFINYILNGLTITLKGKSKEADKPKTKSARSLEGNEK